MSRIDNGRRIFGRELCLLMLSLFAAGVLPACHNPFKMATRPFRSSPLVAQSSEPPQVAARSAETNRSMTEGPQTPIRRVSAEVPMSADEEITPDVGQTNMVNDFAPARLSPLSPAALIEPGPIPNGYHERLDEFDRIGTVLAKAADRQDIHFRFETIYNPRRASTCHTEAGHILVTSALLEKVSTRHQLAGALAMEMAECIKEIETVSDQKSAIEAGVPESVVSSRPEFGGGEQPAVQEIVESAQRLLDRAGFESMDLWAVVQDLNELRLADAHEVSKPGSAAESDEPAWQGPSSAVAN